MKLYSCDWLLPIAALWVWLLVDAPTWWLKLMATLMLILILRMWIEDRKGFVNHAVSEGGKK